MLLSVIPSGFAQVFFSDFNSGVPAGASLPAGPEGDANEARVDGGYLKLTDAVNSSCGYFYVNDFTGGGPVNQFVASFKASLFGSLCCGAGGTRPADGFSFNLVPAATLNPNPAYIPSEDGLAEGLAVTFDTWDAVAPGVDGPNIEVKWQGTRIGVANIQPSQSPAGATTPEASAKLVRISLHPDGKIDVAYGDEIAFAGLQTPYDASVIGAPAWVLTARTGGANDNHWIDDLQIVTAPASKLVIAPQGSVWAFNDTTVTPGLDGTGWELPAYDTNSVPGWKEGIALFGNDGEGIYNGAGQPFSGGIAGFQTPLDRLINGTAGRVTFYLRTKFTWAGSAAGVTLTSSNWVDDSMVAYLNGVEVSRIRLPEGPLTWDTLGSNPGTEGAVEVVTWDASGLVEGENTVAVEVHQSSTGSSDVAFALSLSATGPLAPVITDLFQPTNRIVIANRETTLTVGAIGSPAPTYQWYKDGNPIDGATGSSYTIPIMAEADAGDYFARVTNPLGSVDSRTAVVGYNFDETPPIILQIVGSGTFDTAVVAFNELLDPTAANDAFSFSIVDSGGNTLNVTAAALNADGKSVTLTTDPQTPDTVYTVTVTGVADAAGNTLPAPISADFRSWVPGPSNGVLFETYDVGTVASGIDDLLTNQPNFPNNPRESLLIGGFDSRLAYADDSHEYYAGRMRGLFIPPVSGNWVFHMRSDDPGRLYFNPTGPSAAGAIRVGDQPGCCNVFPATGQQLSQPYALVGGQGYYVELLWREFGGGDYGQVAVALQGAAGPVDANLIGSLVGSPAAPAGIGGGVTIAQQPASQTVLANAFVTFTVQASNPNGLPIAYQWTRDGADIPGATSASYSLGPVAVSDNGAVFAVKASVIGMATALASSPATLTVEEDLIKPTLTRISGTANLGQLVLTFSELVTSATAVDPFNYSVAGGPAVAEAILGADGKTVTLKLDGQLTAATTYQVTVQNITDLSNNQMDAVTVPVLTFEVRPGFALTEIYQNIGGGVLVSDLTGNPKYPAFPDLVRYKGLFELNTFDEFENYGARMSGWLTAPVSGNYNFFMSSDDGGALYLSTDENPANLALIASEPVWNGRRDWQGTTRRNAAAPENKSSTLFPGGIALTAGQRYYFEALVKEGGGGDNLAVTWQIPGAAEPLSGSAPISGIYMSSLVDPTGANLAITQQPTDQVFVIAADTLLTQDFNSNDGGFTVETPDGAFNTPWTYDGAGNWVVRQEGAEVGHPMTARLTSPEYSITKSGGVTLRMDHRWSMESGFWDGGVIQVSVNGGDFITVPGNALSQGGYNGSVLPNSASAAKGLQAFVQDSAPDYVTTVASLGSFNAGDKIRLRFLYAGDTNTGGSRPESWQIDSIQLNQGGGAAQNVTFAVTIDASKAGETTPTTFFQWMRDDGAGYQPVPGGNSASLTFTPILADDGAKFKCQVYILGANATSTEASLRVVIPNTPPRFTAGPSQTVNEDAGPQSVSNWATDIIHHSVAGGLVPANFDALPVDSVIGGNAAVTGGSLHLTDAINSQQSSFVTPASPSPLDSLVVSFKARIGGGTCCGDRTADGWSVTIGDVAVPVTFPLAAEEGAAVSGGLVVSFDSWDNSGAFNDDANTAPNVDLQVGGATLAYQAFDGIREGGRAPSGPFITDPATGLPMSYKTGDAFTTVRIQLDPDGTLDVEFKGVKVVNNVQTGLTLPLNNARVALGARTGGANDNHWIDDLLIQGSLSGTPVVVYPPQSAGIPEQGQTVAFLVENDSPSLFSVQPAVSPDGTLTYTPAPNANGIANVTVRAQDSGGAEFGGNDTSAPQTFTITVNAVCDVPVAANDTAATDSGVPVSIDVLANDTDVEGGLTITAVTQGANGSVAINGASVTYTPAAALCSGSDTFTYTVANACGASSTAQVTVTVADRIAPSITCPADQTAESTSANGAVVNYPAPVVTDNCSLATVAVCVPASGSTFAVGETTVTCTATDGANNRATCSFKVTVRSSTQPPVAVISTEALVDFTPDFENPVLISCNWWNACLVLDGWSSTGTDLTYLWFDELEPVPFDGGPVTTNCYEVGTHTITLTVTDAAGLSGSDSKTIEVVTAPLAIELLIEKVNESHIPRRTKRELVATLRTAQKQAGNEKIRQTQQSLDVFEKKVRAQVAPGYPEEARVWIRWSQATSEGMEKCIKPPRKSKDHYDDKKNDRDDR